MPLLFIFLLFFFHAGTGGIHKFLVFLIMLFFSKSHFELDVRSEC